MVAAACGLAMLVAACGGSSSKTAVATVPASTLTRAAFVSSAAPGYRAIMRMQETVGSTQIAMTGSGSFSPASKSGSMMLHMGVPGAAAAVLGATMNVRAVISHGTVYMKMPAAITSRIPGGRPWWKVNVAAGARSAAVPGLSSLTNGTSQFNDPGQYLDYLRAASAGSVHDLGPATVRGTATTHYRADIDIAKLPDAVPRASRAGVKQLAKTLQTKFGAKSMPIDVWVDSRHRVRQIDLDYALKVPTTGQMSHVSMLVDFVAYGHQAAPTIPPASKTTDLLALLHQLMP
jgi:hypothetical protein